MSLLAFFHPAMLWFAGLAAVPLIIHLLNRRRYKTVQWAAMEFLLAAYKKKHRRMRLENLLLLLLRCAIPVILAFAVARPFFGADHPLSMIAEQRRDVVLMIDESYSMNRLQGTRTLLAGVRTQIERLVTALEFDSGDTFTIMTLAKQPRTLVQGASSRSDLQRALDRFDAATAEEADLTTSVDHLLSRVLPELPSTPEIYLFSDFQRRTFEPPLLEKDEDPDAEIVSLRTLLTKITDEGASLRLINLSDGLPPPDNSSVLDLRSAEPMVITHQSVRITAQVIRRSETAGPGSGYFRIDDRERPVSFRFGNDGRASVEIYESFATPGDHRVEFHLEDDELEDDNSRYLRLHVKESVPLLLVDGDPKGLDELDGEVGGLIQMLDPQYGETSGDDIQRMFEAFWMPYHEFNRGAARLDEYDAVILANVRELDPDRVTDLENYVRRGGGVWFFMGDQVRPDSYNSRLYKEGGEGLLPMRLLPEPEGEVPLASSFSQRDYERWFRMQIVDELHPAVRESVAKSRRRNLSSAAVYRYLGFDMTGEAPLTMQVPIKFTRDQVPALVDHSLGAGHVMWFVSSADPDWGILALATVPFFTLAYDVVNYLVLRDPGDHQLGVGDAIRRSVPAAPEPYTVTRPGGDSRLVQNLPAEPILGHFPLEPFTETQLPGIYTLDLRMGAGEDPIHEFFAVNVNPEEGDLGSLDREELTALMNRIPFEYGVEVASADDDETPRRQGEIWKTLMALLLGMLAVETVLAWRFGAYS